MTAGSMQREFLLAWRLRRRGARLLREWAAVLTRPGLALGLGAALVAGALSAPAAAQGQNARQLVVIQDATTTNIDEMRRQTLNTLDPVRRLAIENLCDRVIADLPPGDAASRPVEFLRRLEAMAAADAAAGRVLGVDLAANRATVEGMFRICPGHLLSQGVRAPMSFLYLGASNRLSRAEMPMALHGWLLSTLALDVGREAARHAVSEVYFPIYRDPSVPARYRDALLEQLLTPVIRALSDS